MADKKIQIKDKSGNKLYPAIDLSLSNNIGTLPNEKIASVNVSKLTGTLPISKGGTGSTTSSGARTNLGVYSKTEVDNLIAGIDQFQYQVVTQLPTASASTMFIIYLIAESGVESGSYVEYLTIDKGSTANPRYVWEKIGTTSADLAEYSKNTHKHTFTGSQGNLSVSGTYSKTTVVTIGTGTGTANYTPAGSVTTTRATDVAVNTTTVNSITGVGTLPTLTTSTTSTTGDIPVLTDVSASHTLTVNHSDPTFSTSNVYSITGVGSLPTMTYDATADGGQAYIKSLAKGSYTPAGTISASFAGTQVSKDVSITPKGSVNLGSNTTADGGVKYVEGISSTKASGTTQYIHPTTETVVTGVAADGTTTAITGATKTTKYMTATFAGNEVSGTVDLTAKGSVKLTNGTAPSLSISNANNTGYNQYVQGISSTGASGTLTGGFVTDIDGGSGSLTAEINSTNGIKYVESVDVGHASGTSSYLKLEPGTTPPSGATFTGTQGTITGSYTPEGTITLTRSKDVALKTATVNSITAVGSGSLTSATNSSTGDIAYIDSVTPAGGTASYIHWSAGSVTTTSSYSDVRTGGSEGSEVTLTGSVATGTKTLTITGATTSNYLYGTKTTTIKGVNSAGSAPSLTVNSTPSDIKYIYNVTGGTAGTTKYLHHTHVAPTKGSDTTVATGISAQPAFTAAFSGKAGTLTGSYTPAGSVTLTAGTAPTLTTSTATSTGAIKYINKVSNGTSTIVYRYLHHSHNPASVKTTASAITAVSGGTTTPTLSYMKFNAGTTPKSGASFTGSPATGTVKLTPTGSVTLTSNTKTSTGAITYLEGFTTTTSTVLTGVKASGTTAAVTGLTATTTSTAGDIAYISAVGGGTTTATTKYFHPSFTGEASKGNLTFTPAGSVTGTFSGTATTALVTGGTTSYMHFGQGSLPTRSGVIKAYTGVATAGSASLSGDVSITKTNGYLRFSQGSLPTKGSNVTVATGIKTQPTFNSTFKGTGTQLTANVTNTATTITSTGKFTPSGTIGTAE